MTDSADPAWIVLGRDSAKITAIEVAGDGGTLATHVLSDAELSAWVAGRERTHAPRWVWTDTSLWYPRLLADGVRVARCHDLRLCHAILRDTALVDQSVRPDDPRWSSAPAASAPEPPALFDLEQSHTMALPTAAGEALAELSRQNAARDAAADPARLRLLLAAESAGALIGAELTSAGVPWDAGVHDRILTDMLGERPVRGGLPERVDAAARRVRDALGDPAVSLDSQPKLLRALHRVGVLVESTSRWELAEQRHPVVEPLLEYKKLTRLLSANGWAWLDEWVTDGRFRPVYVPGGVVTGRWASSGGGALQLPRQLRPAVRADPGWSLVIADVAQLEPRVLAAMARDLRLADAARGRDLYQGIVETGAVASRQEAKIAMLGAMYGATTGESGRLVPRLRRAFPAAMDLVDEAARVGADGGIVSTWLGRSCPPPGERWNAEQARATEAEAGAADVARARRAAGDRGRFTRNFVVQGTAAEWALAWLADLRGRLSQGPLAPRPAPRSGPAMGDRAHLAFFLHDEVIVHTPTEHAEEVAHAVQDAANAAGALLFGGFPVDFRLDVRIAQDGGKE
jgi:DNA polymerase-1